MSWYILLIAAVAVERVVELDVSTRNRAWSRARSGAGYGIRHYPTMVTLHTALLVGCVVEVVALQRPFDALLGWPMLALVVGAQVLRWWCVTTPTGGPYRFFSHPNYVAVVVEGIALPLVQSAWITALVFTVLNAALSPARRPVGSGLA
jgi:methyltransferase